MDLAGATTSSLKLLYGRKGARSNIFPNVNAYELSSSIPTIYNKFLTIHVSCIVCILFVYIKNSQILKLVFYNTS